MKMNYRTFCNIDATNQVETVVYSKCENQSPAKKHTEESKFKKSLWTH